MQATRLDQKYDHLSQETWDQLIRLGLIRDVPKSDGYMQPRWTLKTTYYWRQTFPAHQQTVIDHSYLPSVGGVVPMPASDLLANPINLQIDRARGLNRFCIDQDFLNTLNARPKMAWEQHFLEYVLVTGANWSGPIKNFRLVVDKGSPENLVSFCGQGVQKISPTQFEVRVARFVPTANLSVLILTPSRAEAADDRQGLQFDLQTQDLYTLNCDQLWYQRNSIFKAAGYCFQTPRGIRVFGNAGCRYDNQYDVPLSDRDRQVLKLTQQIGRMRRCPR